MGRVGMVGGIRKSLEDDLKGRPQPPGPVISHSTGWCLKLPHHRARLKQLLALRRPKVLFAAPTCGPWSNSSTTMSADIKAMIREDELVCLTFLYECFLMQSDSGRMWLLENPRPSELLKLDISLLFKHLSMPH